MPRFDDHPSIPHPRTSQKWSCDVAEQRCKEAHKHRSKEVIEHMQSHIVPFRNLFLEPPLTCSLQDLSHISPFPTISQGNSIGGGDTNQ